MKTFIVACALFSASSSFAGDFEVKGFEIGMPSTRHATTSGCRVDENGSGRCFDTYHDFTIGGEKIKHSLVYFESNKAVQIYFGFESDGFDQIRDALKSKFKSIKCKDSVVSNAMGAKFMQTECVGRSKNETISLSRYVKSINDGALVITTNETIERAITKKKSMRDDI